MRFIILTIIAFAILSCQTHKIDRQPIFERHTVILHEADTLNSLSLGNGRFAMTMDVTGLQTFPNEYAKGVPLGTQSEWGWHSFPSRRKYTIEETLDSIPSHGRKVPYAIQWPENISKDEAANYIRQNPHRIHLANIGWSIRKSDGRLVSLEDIKNIDQSLNVWKGEISSRYTVEGIPVEVISQIDQNEDILGVKIKTKLIKSGKMGIIIRFPYPSNKFLDEAITYRRDERSRLTMEQKDKRNLSIQRILDTVSYFTSISSNTDITISPNDTGYFIKPDTTNESWAFFVSFSKSKKTNFSGEFEEFRQREYSDFQNYWNAGGIIDFGATADPRARELERRMVLSLYLTKINCSGNYPPQETGLTYNSWFGRPHMEMEWWHGVQFALWGHPEILQKQMNWYIQNSETARGIAKRQGFTGVRWQKMTDNEGGETVSSVGSFLVWQQPHPIYLAELLYTILNNKEILDKYYDIVENTADFMADFAWYESNLQRYILGPGIMPAQERFDPKTTFNPAFELAYWRWGLETAQIWRERKGLARNKKWDDVLRNLSNIPMKGGQYLAAESAPDSYVNDKYMTDHPMVLAIYGLLPASADLDKKIMENTFKTIWNHWNWNETWGWDFPMTAMTATRLNQPDKALEALLLPVKTNTYLINGHNLQNVTLRIYLPGNGSLLTALSVMAMGTDENKKHCQGFPKDWNVRFDGLYRIP